MLNNIINAGQVNDFFNSVKLICINDKKLKNNFFIG
jgi:hypothetical protein